MKNYSLQASIYGFSTLFVLLSFVFLATYQLNSDNTSAQIRTIQNKPLKEKIKIFNKTNSFQIINIKTLGDETEVLLKNNYGKSINGFYATVGSKGDDVTYNIELAYSEVRVEIPPNETFNFRVSSDEKLYKEGLILRAVMFTDGTGDGEADFVQEMNDIREGEKHQFSRGLELLKDALQSSDFAYKLENLILSIESFATTDKNKSHAYNSGLYWGKSKLIYYVNKIQKDKNFNSYAAGQEWLKLQLKLEKFSAKTERRRLEGGNSL